MRHRASQEDMRSVVSRAVGLALQAHRDSNQLCEADAAAASRSRSGVGVGGDAVLGRCGTCFGRWALKRHAYRHISHLRGGKTK
jgi:hypothetical protein